MEQRYSYGLDSKTNNFVKEFQAPRVLTINGTAIEKNQIDGYLQTVQDQQSRMADFNSDLYAKVKKELGLPNK